jgi:hypothetical protein
MSFLKALAVGTSSSKSIHLSRVEIRKLIEWNGGADTDHVLKNLRSSQHEDGVNELITWLIEYLTADSVEDDGIDEPLLPTFEQFIIQYSKRAIFEVQERIAGEQLEASWDLTACRDGLSSSYVEKTDIIQMCDLMSLSQSYCGVNFDFKLCFEDLCKSPKQEVIISKKLEAPSRKIELHIAAKETAPFGGKRPFQPSRGRGGFRHSNANRGNDLFRSRPPNTSRPPSMHVDDFVALEHKTFSTSGQSISDYSSRQEPPSSRTFNTAGSARSPFYEGGHNQRQTSHAGASRNATSDRFDFTTRDDGNTNTRSHWSKSGANQYDQRRDSTDANRPRQDRY